MTLTYRKLYIAGAALCLMLIAAALYFQHVLGMEPCPLCIFQRLAVIATGLVLFVAAVHNPAAIGRRVYAILALLTAASGGAIATRHIWLQNLPADEVPTCGPGLNYILDTFPLHEALSMVLKGSGECAEVHWSLLGLTIPGWTLIMFVILSLLSLTLLIKR